MTVFRDNAAERRYELDAPEGVSFADYRDVAGVRAIMHVETPPTAQGKGYASALMNEVVADARARGVKLRASCSFAAAYFKRHADASDVLA
jgi:predicted GNAT family acetyltransferase